MNDTVEEFYTQMFAPHQIPQSVTDLYERTVFLANRRDVQLNVGSLVLIAAFATKSAKSSISKPIIPEDVDMAETVPAQKDVGIETGVEATVAETPVQPQTTTKPPDNASGDEHGPTGLMDAPTPPGPQKGMSVKRLMQLTAPELRTHAKEFYGLEAKKTWGKKKIALTLKTMNPIKPGAVANKPNGA